METITELYECGITGETFDLLCKWIKHRNKDINKRFYTFVYRCNFCNKTHKTKAEAKECVKAHMKAY